MTLAEAIAEVKRLTPADDPWAGDDFSCAQPDYEPARTDHAIATILNAVASGDLIPAPRFTDWPEEGFNITIGKRIAEKE